MNITKAVQTLLRSAPKGSSPGDAYRHACQVIWDRRNDDPQRDGLVTIEASIPRHGRVRMEFPYTASPEDRAVFLEEMAKMERAPKRPMDFSAVDGPSTGLEKKPLTEV